MLDCSLQGAACEVHHLQQAIVRRGRHPETGLWETEDGRQWLRVMIKSCG